MSRTLRFQLLLIMVGVVVYAPGLTAPFTLYDDNLYVTDNTVLREGGLSGLLGVWSPLRSWSGTWVEYFPLRDSVYWVLFQAFGLEPLPYHLVSLFFHLVSSLLVFALWSRVQESRWVAAMAALLFVVHPVHVEAVTWIAGLKDPMFTSLMLGSILAWLRWRDEGGRPWFNLSLALLVASLLCKSVAVVTPLLMLGLELVRNPTTPWRQLARTFAWPVLIAGAFFTHVVLVARLNGVIIPPHGGTWTSHLVLSVWAQWLYARQTLVPVEFRLTPCLAPVTDLLDLRLLVGGLVMLVGALLGWKWRRSAPLRTLAICWYICCLLPVANLVPFPAVMSERYLYAGVAGSSLLVALLIEQFLPRAKTLIAVLTVAGFALTAVVRAFDWQDPELLWIDSDEDPICMIDPEFPAAQAHTFRYTYAHDRLVKYQALDRGIHSVAMKKANYGTRCESLIVGAQFALEYGDPAKARLWIQRAAKVCPTVADVWLKTVQVAMHEYPAVAAEAASKAQALAPSPFNAVLVALAKYELAPDESKASEVEQAINAAPAVTCAPAREWLAKAPAVVRTGLERAVAACRPKQTP